MSEEMRQEALAAYAELGWPAEQRDGRIELVTGTVIDALEVPRAAGILAASWWRYSEGHPDEIRRLPSLPDPRRALVLIAAGERHFFLAQAGECPWQAQDPATTAAAAARQAVIRWHSHGSRIPAPSASGRQPETQSISESPASTVLAAWVHLPSQNIKLPGPATLLHLLATAAAAIRLGPHLLALDDGVLAVPALGEPPLTPASRRAIGLIHAPVAFGFGVTRPAAS